MGSIADRTAALLARPGAGLLLDLDGTLIDSEPVHRGAFREYFAGRGWQVSEHVIREFSGRRAQEVFPVLDGPWRGEDPEVLTAGILQAVHASTLRSVPVPGAARLLAACAQTGLPVAVVTSARRWWAQASLDLLGAGDLALAMVTAEDCVHGKPDPEPFCRGAQVLGLPPGGLLAAEDSPAGIASALAAGVGHVLGVTTTQAAPALLSAGAHSAAPDLSALAAAVEELGPNR